MLLGQAKVDFILKIKLNKKEFREVFSCCREITLNPMCLDFELKRENQNRQAFKYGYKQNFMTVY